MRFIVRLATVVMWISLLATPVRNAHADDDLRFMRVGPAGGLGGEYFQSGAIYPTRHRIAWVTVCSGAVIDSIQLAHSNNPDNQTRYLGPKYGGNGGLCERFDLAQDEYIVRVIGRYDVYVNQLTIVTNRDRVKTWGGDGGVATFSFIAPPGGQIVGFHGKAGIYIDSLGVFVFNEGGNNGSIGLFGPSGGIGGEFFDATIEDPNIQISAIRVCANKVIVSMQLYWSFVGDYNNQFAGERIGGEGGSCSTFRLADDEFIIFVDGNYGWYVDSLEIVTNKGKHCAWGGKGGDVHFIYGAPQGGRIIGFYGASGALLDAIGVSMRFE